MPLRQRGDPDNIEKAQEDMAKALDDLPDDLDKAIDHYAKA